MIIIRALSLGLQFIFDLLLRLTGNTVLSILALSVCVKLLLAPLFKIAHGLQQRVNVQKSRLAPRLDEVNKKYKGEERHKQTLAVYKELGVHPLYALKSLLSAAIQIPLFFAAYHMLSEHTALRGAHFLWIRDLSLPDHLFSLPLPLPYFGGYVNIFPYIMTAITIGASWLHRDASLSPLLLKKQRRSLYLMAAFFFVILYTSPSGMVIYWTMNNALSFLTTLWGFIGKKVKP